MTANDVVPGVWEAVVQAMPGDSLSYSFAAGVPLTAIVPADTTSASRSVSVTSVAGRDTTLMESVEKLGVVTRWQAEVQAGGPYTRTFTAPEWATQVVVEVRLSPEFWNTVTDFGVTLFDRDGAQLGQGPMNYDFNRVTVDLPAKRGPTSRSRWSCSRRSPAPCRRRRSPRPCSWRSWPRRGPSWRQAQGRPSVGVRRTARAR